MNIGNDKYIGNHSTLPNETILFPSHAFLCQGRKKALIRVRNKQNFVMVNRMCECKV